MSPLIKVIAKIFYTHNEQNNPFVVIKFYWPMYREKCAEIYSRHTHSIVIPLMFTLYCRNCWLIYKSNYWTLLYNKRFALSFWRYNAESCWLYMENYVKLWPHLLSTSMFAILHVRNVTSKRFSFLFLFWTYFIQIFKRIGNKFWQLTSPSPKIIYNMSYNISNSFM
jgi:hypothetical protein